MYNQEKFLKENLKSKVSYLQDEHKKVLEIIYDDARKNGIIQDFKFHEYLAQSMKYTDIRKEINNSMSDIVLNICLLDLERLGFIINTMRNPYKETEFALCQLGLEYYKFYL